jgi:hypothetical protein
MRLLLEGLLLVGGALALFWFAYRGWLRLRREQEQADLQRRRDEDDWFESHVNDRKG